MGTRWGNLPKWVGMGTLMESPVKTQALLVWERREVSYRGIPRDVKPVEKNEDLVTSVFQGVLEEAGS